MPVRNESEYLQRLRDTLINTSIGGATASYTLAVGATRRFIVYHLELEAPAGAVIRVRSGTAGTYLTGQMTITSTPRVFTNPLTPIFVGENLGDAFVIEQVGGPAQLHGFVSHQEIQNVV